MPVMHWSAPGAGLGARHRSRAVAAGRVASYRGHDDTLSGPGRSTLADSRLPAGAAGRPMCRLQPCDCHIGRSVDGCGTRPGTTALRCDLKNFGGFLRFLGSLPGVWVSRGLWGLRGCWGCGSFWGFRAWPCGASARIRLGLRGGCKSWTAGVDWISHQRGLNRSPQMPDEPTGATFLAIDGAVH